MTLAAPPNTEGLWLAPSIKRIGDLRKTALVAAIPGLITSFVWFAVFSPRLGTRVATVLFACAVGALALLFAFMAHYDRTIRIFCEGGRVGRIDPIGRRHEYPVGEVRDMAEVSVAFSRSQPPKRLWLLVSQQGSCLMRLVPDIWDPAELEAFLKRIGAPLEKLSDMALAPAEVNQRVSGALPWWMANASLIGGALAIALIGIISAALIATGHA